VYQPIHVALCDADVGSAVPIGTYLSEHGLSVTSVSSIFRLDRLLAERGADIVILDGEMPGADPLSLTRRLSGRGNLGILVLSRCADCLAKICALEAGADDFLAKPAEPRELLARVKAILRRLTRAREVERDQIDKHGARFGDYRLDVTARRLVGLRGKDVALTDREFRLLRVFAEHPNRALSRDSLAELAYSRGWTPFDRSLDIRISRLRQKIEPDPARPQVIATVRGVGYRYEACV
jgi:DNA-binding response OmpR family regulator